MLSKNHWVRPFFVFFRFTREILFVTVALDHPVYQLLGISSHKSQGPSHHRRSKLTLGCHFNSYQLLRIKFSKGTYPYRRSRRARDVVRNHINYQVTRSHTTHLIVCRCRRSLGCQVFSSHKILLIIVVLKACDVI